MQKFDLTDLDFRALKTLRLVYDLGSFTRAAELLGQNQSTVSYTIERLRGVFGDVLFVRQGRGVAPTARCDEIVAGVRAILDQVTALAEPPDFDPLRTEADVILSCNHYERAVILPAVLRHLRREAPGIRLKILQSRTDGHQQLRRGECDLLLSPVHGAGKQAFRRLVLEDGYVCIADPDNPVCGGTLTADAYAAARHVLISYEGAWKPGYLELAEAQGVTAEVIVDLPSSGELGRLIAGTDLVATVPRLLAATLGDAVARLPAPFDSRLKVYQYWTTRTNLSPIHRWFRDLVSEEARKIARAGR
nr:LysR family transcriptional regulator [Polymorphum gilvum]